MTNHSTNLLYGCNGEVTSPIPRAQAYIVATTLLLIVVISIFGNVLVIVSVFRFKTLQTSTNALLCSLAITDMLGPVLRLPTLSSSLMLEKWLFGCQWCVASSIFGTFFSACSINNLCLISIERGITILRPYKARELITKKTVSIAIAAVWVISLLMASFPLFGIASVYFNTELLNCDVDLQDNQRLGRVLLITFYFLLPTILMVAVYVAIFKEVRVQTKEIFRCSIGSLQHKHKLKIQAEVKAAKTVMIVIGVFFLLWLPYFTTRALKSYFPDLIAPWWKTFSFTIAYFNSCCNWMVYGVRNKKMRKAFASILKLKTLCAENNRERHNSISMYNCKAS